ncbi:alpha/beta fold hydrolase [Limimaricola cinnabarinus]|uniref:Lactone-specific esterase n=1 Tax=Limimaricola cinnabarinus LL-001 TaxID=1337093 RepID=U2YIZ6_9RHOB|nr:alpha/beta hydrolase [Limimaricola cinnabarinus]GAD54771.1 lactone-specific esterase [Limimaricola cinnabarinus LL-001]
MTSMNKRDPASLSRKAAQRFKIRAVAGTAIATMAASAYANHRLAKRAERDNPPMGRFITVKGVRLHYLERGTGPALVLLHGNGSMIQDFESSGLIDMAARHHRVIVFDRPGFGHSARPRNTVWTPEMQAMLLHEALGRIGVTRATVLGHSWGCSVAVALADRFPEAVSGLVLASGYYYPSPRADVVGLSAPAVPVLGDVLRYAVSPHLARVIWPAVLEHLFAPRPVPAKFAQFPKEMAVRPSQIRASAAETAMMIPRAAAARSRYAALSMPVAIVAGAEDRLIDCEAQSARLHGEIAQSSFDRLPGEGHMIQQTATHALMAAIDKVAVPRPRAA